MNSPLAHATQTWLVPLLLGALLVAFAVAIALSVRTLVRSVRARSRARRALRGEVGAHQVAAAIGLAGVVGGALRGVDRITAELHGGARSVEARAHPQAQREREQPGARGDQNRTSTPPGLVRHAARLRGARSPR